MSQWFPLESTILHDIHYFTRIPSDIDHVRPIRILQINKTGVNLKLFLIDKCLSTLFPVIL